MNISDLEHLETIHQSDEVKGGFMSFSEAFTLFAGRAALGRDIRTFNLGSIGSASEIIEEPVTISQPDQHIVAYSSSLFQVAIGRIF
ncbi:hypothetical protein cce_2674 [Crocosphaera subtropica ATCC 51142]|uniref:Uncharacterized protein n=1 Tax=Crocosphaera subtropica (strain ATCC 51142 / BH68) TaxID=43989 RepID=B1WTA0_CROS5|nr:hypothetical protein [Crocosphaera subtropica]ACB52022.1 hypothetical protein cce_2674 [Crocosphaera subtropica ATCC 51142]